MFFRTLRSSSKLLATTFPFAALSFAEKRMDDKMDDIAILPGSTCIKSGIVLAEMVGCTVGKVRTQRFSDGETLVLIDNSVRGKNVYVMQTCAAPTSDNIIELLQMISAARNSGADKVTAVIPYFGYRFNRRGMPLHSSSQSRFVWSAAFDFANMLQVMGADNIISIDLQRPGQGHEACFFDNLLPVESVFSGDIMATEFLKKVKIENNKVAVLSATPQCVKKARRFQNYFKNTLNIPVQFSVFVRSQTSGAAKSNKEQKSKVSELLGDVNGCDVVIVDEVVDSGGTMSEICRQLKREGAKRIFLCASHGIFSGHSMDLIDLSPVEYVFVTDSIPVPANASKKIVQVSMLPTLAKIIKYEASILDEEVSPVNIVDDNEDLTLD